MRLARRRLKPLTLPGGEDSKPGEEARGAGGGGEGGEGKDGKGAGGGEVEERIVKKKLSP